MTMLGWLAIAMLLAAGTLATAQDEPIFHATFDGTLTASGAGGEVAPAEVVGGEASFEAGRLGRALVAGAGQPLIHYPSAGNLVPTSGTVSLWVQPVNWTPDDEAFHSFFESGGAEGDRDWLIFYKYYQSGWLLLRCSDGEGRVGIAKALDLGWQPGEWHHLAGTWSPRGLRIYVDGEFAAQQEAAIVVPDRVGATFKVGDDGWHVPNPEARTLIDDLRVYSHPLSESEIARLAGRVALSVSREPLAVRWDVEVRLPVGIDAGTVALQVRRPEAAEAALATEVEAAEGVAQASLDVADLPVGEYAVTAELVGGETPTLPASVAMRQPEQAIYVLENGRMRVVFDGATGGVLAIEAPDRGLVARVAVAPEPLLAAETLSYTLNPWFYRDADVTQAPADDSTVRAMRLEPVDGGQRYTVEYELLGGARATVTADLPDGAATVQLRATVANSRPLWPSTAIRIPRVIFPMVNGLRLGESAEDDRLATGLVHGEELVNPTEAIRGLRVAQYPGRACVPWQDLFDGAGGVSLSPLTDGRCQLEVLARGGEGTMALGNRWWALLEPGETWESPVVELSVHEGQWHPVAERFREWSLANTPPRAQPEWLADCDGWVGAGSQTYTFAGLPEMLATAKEYGLSYIQLWSEMVLGTAYYCYFYPNPEMGTVEDLKRGLAAVHEGGGHVGFYSNAICFDGGIDQNPALQDLIEQYGLQDEINDLPRFYEEVAPYVFTGHDGVRAPGAAAGHSLGGYVDGYWPMDPASPWWRDYLAGWITRWQDEYGADVWYLDSFPVHGYGIEPASFSRYLDHPAGTGGAQIGLLQHIRDAGFVGPMLYEGVCCAALMPWTNWCLGTELAFGSGEWSRPEIFCYSLSDVYPVFSGTCNRWTGIGSIWTDLAEPRHEDAMNFVFLNGERFDALGLQDLAADDPYAMHMKQLIALRARLRDVVYGGRMMDTLGLSGVPERVAARIFVRQEPAAAVVTVVDRREGHAPWEPAIDTSALPWPEGITRATLLTLDGEERPVELRPDGATIRIPLDGQGEVCALRME